MKYQLVGVVGAGIMGRGVSLNLVQTGHRVILIDIASNILDEAKKKINDDFRLQTLFNKNKYIPSSKELLDRIKFTTDYEALHEVDFVVENVTENWEIKRELYQKIDQICPGKCIFASNTSTIPVTRLGSLTNRAPQIIGMHFMNPVPFISTVEVIRGYHTSEKTIENAKKLLLQMGKDGIVVNDSPGFVSNRVLMLTINEAIYLLHEQVASVEDVDRIFKKCFGHKMGPLETADLIGLDTILFSIKSLYKNFHDSKYRPCPLLEKMVDAGLHGRKSGQGFYNYSDGT